MLKILSSELSTISGKKLTRLLRVFLNHLTNCIVPLKHSLVSLLRILYERDVRKIISHYLLKIFTYFVDFRRGPHYDFITKLNVFSKKKE